MLDGSRELLTALRGTGSKGGRCPAGRLDTLRGDRGETHVALEARGVIRVYLGAGRYVAIDGMDHGGLENSGGHGVVRDDTTSLGNNGTSVLKHANEIAEWIRRL